MEKDGRGNGEGWEGWVEWEEGWEGKHNYLAVYTPCMQQRQVDLLM